MRCIVEFRNNPSKTYYPGDVLSLCLKMHISEDKYFKSMIFDLFSLTKKMSFFYKSTVLIGAIKGRVHTCIRKGVTAHFGKLHVASKKTVVLTNCFLTAGIHRFKFKLRLPNSCPASFKGELGHIKYEVVILTPTLLSYDRIPFEFTVLSHEALPFFANNVSFFCFIFLKIKIL